MYLGHGKQDPAAFQMVCRYYETIYENQMTVYD